MGPSRSEYGDLAHAHRRSQQFLKQVHNQTVTAFVLGLPLTGGLRSFPAHAGAAGQEARGMSFLRHEEIFPSGGGTTGLHRAPDSSPG